MAKEISLRRMVYVGIGLVITEAAFSAFVVLPRLAKHSELIDSIRSYRIISIIRLIVVIALLALFIPNRHNIGRIQAFLKLAGVLVILLSFPLFSGANYYSDVDDVAILLTICLVANLIAGILFIAVPIKFERSTSEE